ncbi:MAG: hypothetical protein WCB04_11865 [Mycobacteriales bacterium]
MWSGPRNISTAMMRAWGSRPHCHVVDEPLYAYYLSRTGSDHPGRDDVIASQSTDWRDVITGLTRGPVPAGTTVFFQKHMAQHLLPEIDRGSLAGLRHAFLIRDPAEVLVSYAKVRGEPTIADLGLTQQVELYDRFGGPVVDSRDVLRRPEATLRALCGALGVDFDPAMLSWPAGPRETDGVWGRYWYDGVWRSTGFAADRPPSERVPERLQPLLDQCRPHYDRLAEHRLRAEEN